MKSTKILKRFRIDDPDHFRLASIDPADTCGLDLDKDDAKAMLAEDTERLADLQERLYAHDRWAVLVVLQGMDAAGKDGVIKHVMAGINPQGCEVHPFKAPSAEELDHDFLWRAAAAPAGARRHRHLQPLATTRRCWWCACIPELLARQKLPRAARRQGHLEGALQGHPRLRAPSRAQRHAACSSSSCTSPRRSSASACSRGSTSRPSAGSSSMGDVAERKLLGQVHGRLRGHDPQHQPHGGALVRGARPTTNGSRGWWWRARSSRRWRASISNFRRSTAPRSRRCRRCGLRCWRRSKAQSDR